MNTCRVLAWAATHLRRPDAKVFMDAGVENLNKDVDALFSGSALQRIIAQIDVSFSNSLIEAWWRSLKFQWLFLHHLDALTTLRRLIEFYVGEHNQTIPHHAFRGQTPDEMYFGRGATDPDELAERRREARKRRVEQNGTRRAPAVRRMSHPPTKTSPHEGYSILSSKRSLCSCVVRAPECPTT